MDDSNLASKTKSEKDLPGHIYCMHILDPDMVYVRGFNPNYLVLYIHSCGLERLILFT